MGHTDSGEQRHLCISRRSAIAGGAIFAGLLFTQLSGLGELLFGTKVPELKMRSVPLGSALDPVRARVAMALESDGRTVTSDDGVAESLPSCNRLVRVRHTLLDSESIGEASSFEEIYEGDDLAMAARSAIAQPESLAPVLWYGDDEWVAVPCDVTLSNGFDFGEVLFATAAYEGMDGLVLPEEWWDYDEAAGVMYIAAEAFDCEDGRVTVQIGHRFETDAEHVAKVHVRVTSSNPAVESSEKDVDYTGFDFMMRVPIADSLPTDLDPNTIHVFIDGLDVDFSQAGNGKWVDYESGDVLIHQLPCAVELIDVVIEKPKKSFAEVFSAVVGTREAFAYGIYDSMELDSSFWPWGYVRYSEWIRPFVSKPTALMFYYDNGLFTFKSGATQDKPYPIYDTGIDQYLDDLLYRNNGENFIKMMKACYSMDDGSGRRSDITPLTTDASTNYLAWRIPKAGTSTPTGAPNWQYVENSTTMSWETISGNYSGDWKPIRDVYDQWNGQYDSADKTAGNHAVNMPWDNRVLGITYQQTVPQTAHLMAWDLRQTPVPFQYEDTEYVDGKVSRRAVKPKNGPAQLDTAMSKGIRQWFDTVYGLLSVSNSERPHGYSFAPVTCMALNHAFQESSKADVWGRLIDINPTAKNPYAIVGVQTTMADDGENSWQTAQVFVKLRLDVRKTKLVLKKVVDSPIDDDDNLEFTFQLKFSGQDAPTSREVKLNKGNSWTYELDGIIEGTTVAISETAVSGGHNLSEFTTTWKLDGNHSWLNESVHSIKLDGKENGIDTVTVTATNKRDTGKVTLKKVVDSPIPDDDDLTFKFRVEFSGKNAPAAQDVNLNKGNSWTWFMSDIPEDVIVSFRETGVTGGADLDDFGLTWAIPTGQNWVSESNHSVKIVKGVSITVRATNKRKVGAVEVTKIREGGENKDFKFHVSVKDGAKTILDENFTLKGGQKKKFENLPVGATYRFDEENDGHWDVTWTNQTGTIKENTTTAVGCKNVGHGYLNLEKDLNV